jgi:hypothetical protein
VKLAYYYNPPYYISVNEPPGAMAGISAGAVVLQGTLSIERSLSGPVGAAHQSSGDLTLVSPEGRLHRGVMDFFDRFPT